MAKNFSFFAIKMGPIILSKKKPVPDQKLPRLLIIFSLFPIFRPSLSNMFSSNEAPPICRRPKDPPPPPPPVEQKLLPVTPPRKCFPMFSNDELDRINSVINCQRMADQDSLSKSKIFNKCNLGWRVFERGRHKIS